MLSCGDSMADAAWIKDLLDAVARDAGPLSFEEILEDLSLSTEPPQQNEEDSWGVSSKKRKKPVPWTPQENRYQSNRKNYS